MTLNELNKKPQKILTAKNLHRDHSPVWELMKLHRGF